MDDTKEKDNLTDVTEIVSDSDDNSSSEVPEGRVEGDNGDIVTLGN